jgi:hypothetical protein
MRSSCSKYSLTCLFRLKGIQRSLTKAVVDSVERGEIGLYIPGVLISLSQVIKTCVVVSDNSSYKIYSDLMICEFKTRLYTSFTLN